MEVGTVTLVVFSPTHTTQRVLEAIATGIRGAALSTIDLTPPDARTRALPELSAGLALIGAPVYSGRIPEEAVARLRRVHGRGTPAVVVAVYGNRAFEDALLELRDLALEQGFVPVAGAAFIAEHSYSTAATPIAVGRPDGSDLAYATAFGAAVQRKLAGIASAEALPALDVPGAHPYRERRPHTPMSPITLAERCTMCGACEAACPTAAIWLSHTVVTDERECIRCSACVKVCPTEARLWDNPRILQTAEWLATEHAARREPEVWL